MLQKDLLSLLADAVHTEDSELFTLQLSTHKLKCVHAFNSDDSISVSPSVRDTRALMHFVDS